MKNFAALLVIATLAILVLIFVTNPELLGKIWLYIIGFIGYVVVLVEKGYQKLAAAFTSNKQIDKETVPKSPAKVLALVPEKAETKSEPVGLEQKIKDLEIQLQNSKTVSGIESAKATLTILRYLDDGETTLGLIFLRNKFFAYTLEDSQLDPNNQKKTRIPSGIYKIDFNKTETTFTENYRKMFQGWFDFHIEVQQVPDFSNVFIHVGSTHENTESCILIADGVSAGTSKSLQYSKEAFERFYKTVSALLKSNESVNIQILNEDWFERSKLPSL